MASYTAAPILLVASFTAGTQQTEFSSGTPTQIQIPLVPVSSGALPTIQEVLGAINPQAGTNPRPLPRSPTFRSHLTYYPSPGDLVAPASLRKQTTPNRQASVEDSEVAAPGVSAQRTRPTVRFHNTVTVISPTSTSKMTSPTGNEAQRNSSGSSFKSVVSTLKKVASSTNQESDSSQNNNAKGAEEEKPVDVLPDTRVELEAHLNYHLSDLDRIRNSVKACNNQLQDLSQRAAARARPGPAAAGTLDILFQEMEIIHKQRSEFQSIVAYFHGEIRRIADHRAELDKSQGLECTVYNMYHRFMRENEWNELFAYR